MRHKALFVMTLPSYKGTRVRKIRLCLLGDAKGLSRMPAESGLDDAATTPHSKILESPRCKRCSAAFSNRPLPRCYGSSRACRRKGPRHCSEITAAKVSDAAWMFVIKQLW